MDESCISCRRPKVVSNCGICQEPLCKSCRQFLEASTFSFLETLSDELKHTFYCSPCYDTTVAPALESYHGIMEQARDLYFFFNTQRKMIPVIKRGKEAVRVVEQEDRDETILRLAFKAVEQGYNAVIEADVISKKIRNAGYEKSCWQGSGFPAQIDIEKFERSLARRE